MNKIQSTITHVAVDSSGSWLVIGKGYWSTGDRISPKMKQDLTSLEDRKKRIMAVAFDPSTKDDSKGWIIIAER